MAITTNLLKVVEGTTSTTAAATAAPAFVSQLR